MDPDSLIEGNRVMTGQSILVSLPDARATDEFGIALGRSLPPGTVILLDGDLGSGKTTLVQGIGTGLGIPDPIVSPTFTLVNEYLEGRMPLYHLDLYRLDPSEVAALRPETYWEGIDVPLGLVAIEWAERLPYRPPSYLHISLNLDQDNGRQVHLVPFGDFQNDWKKIPYFQYSSSSIWEG